MFREGSIDVEGRKILREVRFREVSIGMEGRKILREVGI